jgi:non-ribosomal peptide synthetase component F
MVLTLLQARGKLEERDLSALRWVLFAGEVFPTKHLRTLMEKLSHPRLRQSLRTDGNKCLRLLRGRAALADETAPIPIGKACANTDLIPISADGERVVTTNKEGLLYARGSTVMQGYYGRPEASAACFIPNPFASAARKNFIARAIGSLSTKREITSLSAARIT